MIRKRDHRQQSEEEREEALQEHINEYYDGDAAAAQADWQRGADEGAIAAALDMAEAAHGEVAVWMREAGGSWERLATGSADACWRAVQDDQPWATRERPVRLVALPGGESPTPKTLPDVTIADKK
jgi:hypothetical protein